MTPSISPTGRINGTRTTVYHIVPYLEGGRFSLEEIAKDNAITMEELHAALAFIDQNREEVMRVNREFDERDARGNPPEIQAKLDAFSIRFRKFREWLMERRRANSETNGNGRLFPAGTLFETFREWEAREELQQQEEVS